VNARLLHNPRCSKSRQALAILEENKVNFEVIEYLKTPLKTNELEDLFTKLGKSPSEVVRKSETIYKELGLGLKDLNIKEWAKVISNNPILLERPIFDNGTKAIVGRPPEDILALI
jgi:arsenate reductase